MLVNHEVKTDLDGFTYPLLVLATKTKFGCNQSPKSQCVDKSQSFWLRASAQLLYKSFLIEASNNF